MFDLGLRSVEKVAKQFRNVWRIEFRDGAVRYAGAGKYASGELFHS